MTAAPLTHAPQSGPAGPRPGGPAHWWQRRSVKAWVLGILLALSGLVILALVREQTGTEGFLVGLGLATLPVPLLIAAFRWLDRVDPGPWRNLIFSFAWGACAAALIAIVANSFATRWIATATADPTSADTLGATVIAPVVEETAKALAVLLLFLFRRREFTGIVDGVVTAGVTATGFAFTENVLYLGNAYGTDEAGGIQGLALDSVTAATFFVRIVMSPFAHPLFTVFTGIGFGIAALSAPRRRARRCLVPIGGLLLAIGMHALWNGSAVFGGYGFFAVYAAFMVPAFALLTWLTVWTRQRELRLIRSELPAYAAAGWIGPHEAYALSSMRARRIARDHASHHGGPPAARAVAEYAACATSLAFLRHRGRRGRAGADFLAREQELLGEIWLRRHVARPALEYAARATAPPPRPYAYAHPPAPVHPGAHPHPYAHAHPNAPSYAPSYARPYSPSYAQGPYLPYIPRPAYPPHAPHDHRAPRAPRDQHAAHPAHNPYRSG